MFGLKWIDLIGRQKEFSLEKRVFHAVCLIASLLMLICFPANLLIDLDVYGYVLLVLLTLLLILFYFSRYKSQSKITVGVYIGGMYLVLILGFFYNCGIDGPIGLVFGITFLILASIVKQEQLLFWLVFHVSIGILLLFLEYQFPSMVVVHYENKLFRFLDTVLTMGLLALCIFLTIRFLKLNYNHQLELSNQKNEELQRANVTKDKLFSIISHDLRSPFNALIGLSQILKENGNELVEAEKDEFVNAIYETSTKTYLLLQNLLEWSLSQTNEIQFIPQKISLIELVHNSLLMPLEIARSKEIEIKLTIPENQMVVVDKNMMATVIRNIVSNALKFTAVKGIITISSHADISGVVIQISDNGIGMSPATLSGLFNQKIKGSNQEIVAERGMGLGLMLCKDFIQRHDGKIWAESEQGKGATFYIFLKKIK